MSQYNPKLLEFIYLLNKADSFMSLLEISNYLKTMDFNVTDRTISRWFKKLGESLAYFPRPNYKVMGLCTFAVFFDGLKNSEFFEIVPNCYYIFRGCNLNNATAKDLVWCAIPPQHLEEFKQFWVKTKELGLIDSYFMYNMERTYNYLPPLHKVLDKFGNLNFVKTDPYFIQKIEYGLQFSMPVKLIREICNCPLIIPLLVEYSRVTSSSRRSWLRIYNKLGDSVWNYLPGNIKTKTFSKGVNKVQEIMRVLNRYPDIFYDGINVMYKPLYYDGRVSSYMMVTLKDENDLLKFVEEVNNCVIMSIFYLGSNAKEIVFFVSTNFDMQLQIINDIIPKFSDVSGYNNCIYLDKSASRKFWSSESYHKYLKLNYADLFDPAKCLWKCDIKSAINYLYQI